MSGSDSTHRATFGDGSSVLEQVLLAIINAHTTSETEGRQVERLHAAITALVGPAAREGQDMERALLFMERERQKDICDLELSALRSCARTSMGTARTLTELATLAAREMLGRSTAAAEIQATVRVLCEAFRKRGNAYRAAPDHVLEALETETVQRFCDELAEWGVSTRI